MTAPTAISLFFELIKVALSNTMELSKAPSTKEWIGLSEQIRQQNKVVDIQTAEICSQLKKEGLDAAIIKRTRDCCLTRTSSKFI